MASNNNKKFDGRKLKNNPNNQNDGIFAQLTDMFGDVVSSDTILNVCHKLKWDLTACIDQLIQMSDEPNSSETTNTNNQHNHKSKSAIHNEMEGLKIAYQSGSTVNVSDDDDDDDADVVIESEKIENEVKVSPPPDLSTVAEQTTVADENVLVAQPPNLGAIKKRTSTSSSTSPATSASPRSIQRSSSTSSNNNPTNMNKSNREIGALPKSSSSHQIQYSSFLKDATANQFELPQAPRQSGENSKAAQTFFRNNKKATKTRNQEKSPNYDRIIHLTNSGIKLMVLMRGPSGCGKSHLARQIIDETVRGQNRNHIFSSDDFFCDINDRYNYDASKVPEAHAYNQRRVRKKCHEGWSPIIVDNTNIQLWELFPYVNIAVEFGYFIEILEPRTPWSNSPRQLAQRNRHLVPLYSIERMCENYEHISVPDLLKLRELGHHLELNPQMRRYPVIKPTLSQLVDVTTEPTTTTIIAKDEQLSLISDKIQSLQPEWNHNWTQPNENEIDDMEIKAPTDDTPKPARLLKTDGRDPQEDVLPVVEETSLPGLAPIDWKAHEKEVHEFWENTKSDWEKPREKSKPTGGDGETDAFAAKGQRIYKRPTILHLNKYSVLEDNVTTDIEPPPNPASSPEMTTSPIKLEKHKIDCENENKSFTQIRQIYPNVPIEYLWDLFENCQGDGDWTMDILLKDETKLNEFMINDGRAHENKYFDCSCSKNLLISFDDIPNPSLSTGVTTTSLYSPSQGASGGGDFTVSSMKSTILQPTVAPGPSGSGLNRANKRTTVLSEDVQNTKRKIEESVSIGNEHYSERLLKIRDNRRGVQLDAKSPSSNASPFDLGAYAVLPGDGGDAGCSTPNDCDTESSEAEGEELVEVNLGMELVSQLDNMFGIEAYPKSTMQNMKANVFMSKSFAKQLYALWMESVYNQIEEQKQQSIKEDEEFAKSLHAQEKYPELYKEPKNFKEIMEMQLTWAAYKTEVDEWKNTSPQTMAAQMSKDKLKSIFPGIDQETLDEILAAHNHRFDETVDTLRDTLKFDLNEQMIGDSRDLFEQARVESEMPTENFEVVRSASSSSNRSLEMKKLGPEEAKRLALKDFEECRNSAQHHTQLKVECYAKANAAMQRGDYQVAVYYSQVAKLHKNKVDMYNHKAANCIMEVHNLTQNNPDIIDLHYLHVAEAIECLDIFLDKHINKLKVSPQNFKNLHIITGRGLHSAGGIPTVKHNVKNRLRDRNLKFLEVNPGLLRVKMFSNSKLSQAS